MRQLELLPRPPETRAATNPWPLWPNIFRVSSAHEEGGERLYSISTDHFSGDDSRERQEAARRSGRSGRRRTAGCPSTPVPGSEFEINADLVLLAMGFVGPRTQRPARRAGRENDGPGTVARDGNWMTSVPGVFTAGDMQRGQSLIVWAIAEGRSCARGVDSYLMGTSDLPAPVK